MTFSERVMGKILGKGITIDKSPYSKDLPYEKRRFRGEGDIEYSGKEIAETSDADNGLLENATRKLKRGRKALQKAIVKRPFYNPKHHIDETWEVERIK